ncbi:hypothetical protein N7475_007307 [Penicillium sp. IBT 31633x]|nr:hypothetical protein N7475_007307 [Penicillium sp. IBT 31633x]
MLTEAVALIFRSALTTGALPELDERPSWLPFDQCGRATSDIAMKGASGSRDANLIYHLVNPRTFSWKHDLPPALRKGSALPDFEVVSLPEWLNQLASSEQDPEKNPSIKLIDFWRSKYAGSPLSQGPAAATTTTTDTVKQ